MEVLNFRVLLNTVLNEFRDVSREEVDLFCEELKRSWLDHHARLERNALSEPFDDVEVPSLSEKALKMLDGLEAHEIAILAAGNLGAAMNAQFQTTDLSKRLSVLEVPPISNLAHVMTQMIPRGWLETTHGNPSGHRKFQLTKLGIAELRTLCFRALQHERLQNENRVST